MKILVTGATGFIGRPLVRHLLAQGHQVRAAARDPASLSPEARGDFMPLCNLEENPDWTPCLQGVDCVIHLAGRAHVTNEPRHRAALAARAANVYPTIALYEACGRAHVGRLVFVSTVHVLGTSSGSVPFTEQRDAHADGPYAASKLEAERELLHRSVTSSTELVIVRPTVVCGANAKGNLRKLVRVVLSGLPLPLAAVSGARNFVGLANLCDLLSRCAVSPRAAGQIYLAADPEKLTTPDLIRAIARELHRPARLFRVPVPVLAMFSRLAGQTETLERLTESLLVNSSKARAELGWGCTVELQAEIAAMAQSIAAARP